MVATFPKIFLSSHSSSMFIMHDPLNGISWKVTLSNRIYIWFVFRLSEETILLGPPSHSHGTYRILNLTPPLLFICPRPINALGQNPIDNFRPLSLQVFLKKNIDTIIQIVVERWFFFFFFETRVKLNLAQIVRKQVSNLTFHLFYLLTNLFFFFFVFWVKNLQI